MPSAVLTTVAATGFTVAFFHAAIPTHWLPFVLVARERGWSRGRTLAVASLAGLGHVALTSLLGLGVAWFGFQLEERVGSFSWIAGGMLGVFAPPSLDLWIVTSLFDTDKKNKVIIQ